MKIISCDLCNRSYPYFSSDSPENCPICCQSLNQHDIILDMKETITVSGLNYEYDSITEILQIFDKERRLINEKKITRQEYSALKDNITRVLSQFRGCCGN